MLHTYMIRQGHNLIQKISIFSTHTHSEDDNYNTISALNTFKITQHKLIPMKVECDPRRTLTCTVKSSNRRATIALSTLPDLKVSLTYSHKAIKCYIQLLLFSQIITGLNLLMPCLVRCFIDFNKICKTTYSSSGHDTMLFIFYGQDKPQIR
jgi:hypothetical protein